MRQSDSLRIALFTYSTKPRGSVVHTLELAEALQTLGHSVCVYALDKDGAGFYRLPGCAYELVPSQSVTGGLDELIQQRIQEFVDYLSHSKQAYDCYHAQDCISANALSILRTRNQIPHFIRTVHHLEDFTSPYLQACQDRSIRDPNLCLSVSAQGQSELREQYHIDAPRVINGVNQRRFCRSSKHSITELKQKLGLTGYPIYLTVGGIEPRKNSITLLHALVEVLIQYPQAKLVIAGGATLFDYQPYREAFFDQAEIAGMQIGKSLILPGVLPESDLAALYQAADAFVFPSLKEGWGLVVLEAMASGTPVITSNQPPFTEFLSDASALLVNPQSVAAIAQAMVTVIEPSVAQLLVQEGQAISARYTWDQSATMHLTHYQALLNLYRSNNAGNSLSDSMA